LHPLQIYFNIGIFFIKASKQSFINAIKKQLKVLSKRSFINAIKKQLKILINYHIIKLSN